LLKSKGSIGCSSSPEAAQEIGRITVARTGEAGVYDYTVLAATGTRVLRKWLDEHGYFYPRSSENVFKSYVDRGWHWLAFRLNVKRLEKDIVAPPPIRYTYRGNRCVYPLIISKLSADDNNEIVLYVLSDRRYGCENWENVVVPAGRLKLDRGSASGTNYEEVFRVVTGQGMKHVFVSECASVLRAFPHDEEDYLTGLVAQGRKLAPNDTASDSPILGLTRMRAVLRREEMDRDVVLSPKTAFSLYEPVPIHNVYQFQESEERGSKVLLLIALCGTLLLVARCFTRWSGKRTGWPRAVACPGAPTDPNVRN
jgi:hypothetical protein